MEEENAGDREMWWQVVDKAKYSLVKNVHGSKCNYYML